MRALAIVLALSFTPALGACKGSNEETAAPPSVGAKAAPAKKRRLSATEVPVTVQAERDKLLQIDDALSQVRKKVDAATKVNDTALLAKLRDEERAYQLAYQQQLQHVRLYEFMWKKQLEQQDEEDKKLQQAAKPADAKSS